VIINTSLAGSRNRRKFL